jgi:DNA-binding CsgD family transcriptional regulator
MNIVITLTKREKEIVNLIADGKSNKEIAQILNVSVHTVEKHLNNIYKKLGVNNRASAASLYTRYILKNNGNPL